ncbi:hypothetical protein [Sinomonas humi]|uniref:Uncharacterized protein n=1 Tax=Sinomonas humi TaxID=1338436 RepID=A0A0B2AGT0_9MICC|nr:hypothetical protein [Sinomonas humi]KHL02797.1 hypothetical protein LK10_11570 [Sinomonas humi]
MTSSSGPEDANVEREEEQGGYGSPTPEQEAGGQAGGGQAGGEGAATGEEDDEDQGEHDVD